MAAATPGASHPGGPANQIRGLGGYRRDQGIGIPWWGDRNPDRFRSPLFQLPESQAQKRPNGYGAATRFLMCSRWLSGNPSRVASVSKAAAYSGFVPVRLDAGRL